MSDRTLARLGVLLTVVYVVLTVVVGVLGWQNEGEFIFIITTSLSGFTAFAIVGSLLVSRRPRNPVGWLLLFASLSTAIYGVCIEVAIYGTTTAPGSIALAPFAAWFIWWFAEGFLVLVAMSLFVFPSGRLPSRRWRPVVIGVALFTFAATAVFEFGTAEFGNTQMHVANPLFVSGLSPIAEAIGGFVIPFAFVPLAAAVASLVARYRAGSTTEKQQLKWIVLSALFMVGLSGASAIQSPVQGVFNTLTFLVLPVAVAIAILRYRVFDIDHLISRTLVYGVTSGVIATLFFGGIVALQPALRPLTEGTDLAVAASTLVAFALFHPIRRRIQDAVDRRFDRSRYDAARTLDAFSDELRDEVDLERVEADLLGAISTTMAPQHVSLWLRREIPGMGTNVVTISGRPVVRKELA